MMTDQGFSFWFEYPINLGIEVCQNCGFDERLLAFIAVVVELLLC